MNSNNNNMNNNNNINNNNNRPNLNYNYTYTLSPNNSSNNKHKQLYNNNNSITKPHSTTYITSTTKPLYQLQQQQHLNNNNNRHPQSYTQYHPRKPLSTNIMGMKYYPIINDDQQDVMYNNNKVDYNISNNRELSRKLSQTQSGTLSSFYVNNRERNINNNNNSNLLFIQTNNTVISGKQHQQQQRQQQYQQHQQLQHQQQQQQPTQHIQKYLIWLYQAFGQFEKTGNVRILKDINQKNKNQVVRLIDLVYNEKEKHRERGEQYHYCDGHVDNNNNNNKNNRTQPKTIQRKINNNNNINTTSTQQIFKIKQQIFNLNKQSTTIQQQLKLQYQISNQLQQQLIQQIQIKQGHNLNQSQIRQQNHLNQMQQSIKQLQQEIKTIERKNLQLWKNINNVPFLKEWSLMFDEAKGATKLAVRLKHQIMKKEQLIKQLTNQDPSNNSDARSMKRAGSENGDRPQSKFTKNSNNKVFNYTNNSSNLNTDPAPIPKPSTPLRLSSQLSYKQSQKPQSGRSSNDVIIRHLSHSNRFSQSKKSNNISNSVERTKQRKQSYDQKQYSKNEPVQWKGLAFPSNLKSYGVGFIGKDAYK